MSDSRVGHRGGASWWRIVVAHQVEHQVCANGVRTWETWPGLCGRACPAPVTPGNTTAAFRLS
ncbi:hypothetical protein [Bifidobacterium crudilactis]|jgi:hypothetical protein|uniref:hypothetical protein n=1 Tax=Bifidobacterium crudilactis TaxID=327277 RepID=UPI002353421F|nr:hypothetical protein [Bifidobacterium crudilactis]MCI1218874.1 hypothetical protein [Bifidobacterium crudilactis]